MLTKKISYVDYNGVSRTETFLFNLNKAELAEMQFSVTGGLSSVLDRISKTENTPELIKLFKTIILSSYGVKSDDGKRFIKSKEMADEFCQTEAYSTLFMELIQDGKKFSEFVNGIIPAEVSDEIKKNNAANGIVADISEIK